MRRNDDISAILKRWEYETARTVRRIRTTGGREVLQVRLPLGVEQYEISGRPDGKRPEGYESWLRYFQQKARIFGREFVLNEKECDDLQAEGLLFYYRYLLFFQIGEYLLCARDTSRNIRLLDFVGKHAAKPEYCEGLEQYRPYILRMNIMARTLHKLQEEKNVRKAIRDLEHGSEAIRRLPGLEGNSIFELERKRSMKSLEDLIEQLRSQLPTSKRESLEKEMQEAISREDYEKAATIRDQLKQMADD
jgi:hypothetical protein